MAATGGDNDTGGAGRAACTSTPSGEAVLGVGGTAMGNFSVARGLTARSNMPIQVQADAPGSGRSTPPPPAVALVKLPRRGLYRFVPSQLHSGDYENKELEVLYRRYILKLQQNSISSALILLELVLLATFITGALYSWPRALSLSLSAVLNAILAIVLLCLLAFLSSKLMQDALLMPLCLTIMVVAALFVLAALPVPALHTPIGGYLFSNSSAGLHHRQQQQHQQHLTPQAIGSGSVQGSTAVGQQQVSAADGMWEMVFVLFVCYTMLPTRIRYVVSLGLALPLVHSAVAAHTATARNDLLEQQRSSTYR